MSTFELAACRAVDPELFYPLGREGSPGYERGLAEARAVCSGCPVRGACLRYALDSGDAFAVLAGTTPGQRRELRLRLGRVRLRKVKAPAKRGPKAPVAA